MDAKELPHDTEKAEKIKEKCIDQNVLSVRLNPNTIMPFLSISGEFLGVASS